MSIGGGEEGQAGCGEAGGVWRTGPLEPVIVIRLRILEPPANRACTAAKAAAVHANKR